MKRTILFAAACMATISTVGQVQAGVTLSPGSVFSNSLGVYSAFAPEHLLDQSGLSAGYTSGVTDFDTYLGGNPTHPTSSGNSSVGWASANNNIVTGTMVFDLGQEFTLNRLALWSDTDTQSVGNFSMDISNDSAFSVFSSLGSFNATNNPAPVSAQVFGFTPGSGRYVRWNIAGTVQGQSNLVQAGELVFDASPVDPNTVPEPTSLAIFGIGALCMGAGAARRRRKEKQAAA